MFPVSSHPDTSVVSQSVHAQAFVWTKMFLYVTSLCAQPYCSMEGDLLSESCCPPDPVPPAPGSLLHAKHMLGCSVRGHSACHQKRGGRGHLAVGTKRVSPAAARAIIPQLDLCGCEDAVLAGSNHALCREVVGLCQCSCEPGIL